LSPLARVLGDTAAELPMHIWVLEKKTVYGVQKEFTFLALRLNTTLIIHFCGEKNPNIWVWRVWGQKWRAETLVSNVFFASVV